jgi:hypothetical protein
MLKLVVLRYGQSPNELKNNREFRNKKRQPNTAMPREGGYIQS